MQTLILTLHLIVCFLLVILILLQSGKEGMGVIFGGGNSSVFGSTGAGGILAKLTTLMAIIFVITSLSYTYVTSSRPETESVILNVQIEDRPKPDTASPAESQVVKPEQAAPAGVGVKPEAAPQESAQPATDKAKPEAAPAPSEPQAEGDSAGTSAQKPASD